MDPLQAVESGLETSALTNILLPAVLGLLMLGMGLTLRVGDFKLIATRPTWVAAGLIGQLLLLPLAATLVVFVAILRFGLETELAIGLLLLAAVPGGATSNLLVWLARGDAALSVTLTAITSVLSFLLVPTVLFTTSWMLWGEANVISVPFMEVVKLTLAVVAGPVLLGMALGTRWPRLAKVTERPLRIFGVAFLALLIAGIIYQNRVGFWDFAAATVPAALALNVLALAAGFATASLFRLGQGQKKAVTIEVGFQNGTFAILLAVTQLESARAALMPGFYSLMMYLTGAAVAIGWPRLAAWRAARRARAAAPEAPS